MQAWQEHGNRNIYFYFSMDKKGLMSGDVVDLKFYTLVYDDFW